MLSGTEHVGQSHGFPAALSNTSLSNWHLSLPSLPLDLHSPSQQMLADSFRADASLASRALSAAFEASMASKGCTGLSLLNLMSTKYWHWLFYFCFASSAPEFSHLIPLDGSLCLFYVVFLARIAFVQLWFVTMTHDFSFSCREKEVMRKQC